MQNIVFGVLQTDIEEVSFYLKSGTNLSYKAYNTITDLYKALDNDEVNMIVVPNIMYLDYTIEKNKYSINYYFTEMKKQIVLTLSDTNKKLNTIITKYYNKWRQTNYIKEYNDAYLNYYIEKNQLDAKTKASLVSKNYVYGYVENPPYELKVNGKVAGIAGEYINRISRLADINFKYKKYNTKKELQKAIDKGEIDVYFDYYNYSNNEYLETLSTFIEDYVVLGRQEDNHIVNSFESLKNAYELVCSQGVRNGVIGTGLKWNESIPFGNPEDFQRNIEEKGYYIYSIPVAQQSQAEREERIAPVVQIAIKMSGAIHSSNVIVQVQR